MNIHPLIVHFPIALLSIYAIMEMIRPKRLMASREWQYIKAVFLLLGMLGAGAAVATGDYGKPLFPQDRHLISVHEFFGETTFVLFVVISAIYLVDLLGIFFRPKLEVIFGKLWHFIVRMRNVLAPNAVIIILAIVGVLLVMITGALGATIVYGANNDPFLRLINKIIFGA